MTHRVYVVGVGMVTAGGLNLDHTWQSVLGGKVCSGPMPSDIESNVMPIVCFKIPGPRVGLHEWSKKAAGEALWDAGELEPDLVVVGSTSAGFAEAELIATDELERGKAATRSVILASDGIAEDLAYQLGIHEARAFQFSSACSASSYGIATAYRMVQSGFSSIALAGGADELTAPVVWMFDRARVYANELKPFDKNRKGVVLADGAAFVVLCNEVMLHAANLRPYCEVVGIGLNQDASDPAAPDWTAISACIGQIPMEYDFICAHGTGTKLNDQAEVRAIKDRLGVSPSYISSYKGALGHPQGASGAVGVALTAQVIRTQTIFPTTGLEEPDPDINLMPLDYAFSARVENALVLSYGSWGSNAAIALRRVV